MFIIPHNMIEYLKENGINDYIMDMEEAGNIRSDDKEDIYQYILASCVDCMSKSEYSRFVDGLVHTLEEKKVVAVKHKKANYIFYSFQSRKFQAIGCKKSDGLFHAAVEENVLFFLCFRRAEPSDSFI